MVHFDPRTLVRFTPTHREADEPPPVFLLKAPTVAERGDFLVHLSEHGLRPFPDALLRAQLKKALPEAIPDAALVTRLLEALEAIQDAERTPELLPPFNLIEAIAEAEDEVIEVAMREADLPPGTPKERPNCAAYLRITRDRRRYLLRWRSEATRYFLRGWEDFPHPFEATAEGRPSEASMQCLSSADIAALGSKIEELMAPTVAQRKNSELPPQ